MGYQAQVIMIYRNALKTKTKYVIVKTKCITFTIILVNFYHQCFQGKTQDPQPQLKPVYQQFPVSCL